MLPKPLGQVAQQLEMASVTADGACDTLKCHEAIAERGAAAFGHSLGPVAFVPSLPPRRDVQPRKETAAEAAPKRRCLA